MLKINNLSYAIPEKELFRNISASLYGKDKKKIALVGANGCGKSTFLEIIMDLQKADEGTVQINNEHICYLSQEIKLPTNFEYIGEYLESKLDESWQEYLIDEALDNLYLDSDFVYKKMATLSGGEIIKTALLAILIEEPSIILMDETTNHLDQNGIDWLGAFVGDFNGSVLIVTHNRYFINTYLNQIWEINPNTLGLETVSGDYDDFIVYKEKQYEHEKEVYDRYVGQIREIENWLTANEFHPKYRFSSIVMSKKRALKNVLRSPAIEPVKLRQVKFKPLENEKRGRLFKADIKSKYFADKEILKNINFSVKVGERWQITGINGSGKTTLLNIITGKDEDYDGEIVYKDNIKIGYLQQHCTLNLDKTVLDVFENKTMTSQPESRKILARFMFGTDYVFRKIKYLSLGEQRRLELAIILTNKPDLLLLDEPTNHLDIFMREALEQFLIEIDLGMVVISHDKYFIDKIGVENLIKL